jgi:hypothetical protein
MADNRSVSQRTVTTRVLAAGLLLALIAISSWGKELQTGTGAFLDMPSGFQAGEGNGNTRFSYFDPDGNLEFDILIYDHARYATAKAMAVDLGSQMKAQGDVSYYKYQGRDAAIADLTFTMDAGARQGYAVYVVGLDAAESTYALVATAPADVFDSYSELIISCLDSFSVDRASRRTPGPVSQFLAPFPAARAGSKAVALPAGSVKLPWSSGEAAQELSVAEREYRILTLYLNTDTLWKEAWARYYRMVYKESAARLDALADEFAKNLPSGDPTEAARRALAWVQGFVYERDFAGIDFVPPLTASYEGRGDCDARAVVMAIVLERRGIDAVLMLSRDYSHAMVAVDVPGGGQHFTLNGRSYLVGETTAKWGIGVMDAGMTDLSKWIGVDLGE